MKGQSGNVAGRTRGSTSHNAELKRSEEAGLMLATNVADAIAEAAGLALDEVGLPELIPLIDTITDVAKNAVRGGEIGPSSLSSLRGWFNDHQEGDPEGDFFVHIGLPKDCDWQTFRTHYNTRGRIDHSRHAADLGTYPPIVRRIEELRAERLLIPIVAKPSN